MVFTLQVVMGIRHATLIAQRHAICHNIKGIKSQQKHVMVMSLQVMQSLEGFQAKLGSQRIALCNAIVCIITPLVALAIPLAFLATWSLPIPLTVPLTVPLLY